MCLFMLDKNNYSKTEHLTKSLLYPSVFQKTKNPRLIGYKKISGYILQPCGRVKRSCDPN